MALNAETYLVHLTIKFEKFLDFLTTVLYFPMYCNESSRFIESKTATPLCNMNESRDSFEFGDSLGSTTSQYFAREEAFVRTNV